MKMHIPLTYRRGNYVQTRHKSRTAYVMLCAALLNDRFVVTEPGSKRYRRKLMLVVTDKKPCGDAVKNNWITIYRRSSYGWHGIQIMPYPRPFFEEYYVTYGVFNAFMNKHFFDHTKLYAWFEVEEL